MQRHGCGHTNAVAVKKASELALGRLALSRNLIRDADDTVRMTTDNRGITIRERVTSPADEYGYWIRQRVLAWPLRVRSQQLDRIDAPVVIVNRVNLFRTNAYLIAD